MTEAAGSPVYLAAEAVLEIDELRAGLRDDVPCLNTLFHILRTPSPSPTFEGHSGVSMLADVRSYSVLRNVLGESRTRKIHSFPEFQVMVDRYLKDLEDGVAGRNAERLSEAKSFCQSLGNQLINKQLKEAYQHKEQSDSRYVSHDALL